MKWQVWVVCPEGDCNRCVAEVRHEPDADKYVQEHPLPKEDNPEAEYKIIRIFE